MSSLFVKKIANRRQSGSIFESKVPTTSPSLSTMMRHLVCPLTVQTAKSNDGRQLRSTDLINRVRSSKDQKMTNKSDMSYVRLCLGFCLRLYRTLCRCSCLTLFSALCFFSCLLHVPRVSCPLVPPLLSPLSSATDAHCL